MRIEEIREQTTDELERQLEDLAEELFNLRFRRATQELDNPLRIRVLRKDIARVKTILRERASSPTLEIPVEKEPNGEAEGE